MDIQLTNNAKLKFKEAVRLGLDYELACGLVGLPYSDFIEWIKTSEGQDFFEELKQDESYSVQQMLECIKKSAKSGDKQAHAWLRKHCKKIE